MIRKNKVRKVIGFVCLAGMLVLGCAGTAHAYTEEQKAQAKAWLSAHGYSPDAGGAAAAYQDYLNGKFDEELGRTEERTTTESSVDHNGQEIYKPAKEVETPSKEEIEGENTDEETSEDTSEETENETDTEETTEDPLAIFDMGNELEDASETDEELTSSEEDELGTDESENLDEQGDGEGSENLEDAEEIASQEDDGVITLYKESNKATYQMAILVIAGASLFMLLLFWLT